MKRIKTSKLKFRNSLKLWGLVSLGVLLLGIVLLVTYDKMQDLRSRAEGGEIQFIDHVVAQVPGQDMFITVEKPKNIQPGDILVAMIGSDYAHVDPTPSGWKVIRQDIKNKGHKDDLALQSYYKIVTSEEETSYTWKLVTQRKDTPSEHQPLIAVDLYALRGVDQSNPIFSNNSHAESTSPKAIKCPNVKGVTGGMLLCSYMGDDPGSIEAPSSMNQTSNFEIGGGDSYAAAYETLTSDDKTGPRVAVWNNPEREKKGKLKNGSDFAHAIVLRPSE
jgi:hypothetical protein